MNAPSPAAITVRVDRISKRFDKTVALADVSLEVHAGELFGVVGPNGAGKTTLIRTILDIIKPDTGTVQLFGRPFSAADRDRIGYLPEERGLYPRQKVGAVLEYLAALKGMRAADARREVARWLERFELSDLVDKKVEQLSKGNQQKIQIAATLVCAPAIAILDEPLSGLDPVSARLANRAIRDYAAAGHTVLLSTHQMNLVESLCSRVFMIARGRRVLYGDLKSIKREHSQSNAISVLSDADYGQCPLVASVLSPGDHEAPAHVQLRDTATADEFLGWLVAHHARVEAFERLTMPLEDIFVKVAHQAGSLL
jgi:ABC-2 type transport system ATP-binding protein